jgi:hypothetical protein
VLASGRKATTAIAATALRSPRTYRLRKCIPHPPS